MGLKIWTVGHSTRSFDEFVELLQASDIEAVGDVRSFPGSRRYPHFDADQLGPAFAEQRIAYLPMKALGGRRRAKPDSKHTVWRNAAFRGYADYMETPEFLGGIDDLLGRAREARTTIMCSEAVWWRCHRSMISDYLKSIGVVVEHIMDGGKNVIHPYTSAASIIDGRLVYGREERASG